MTYLLTDDSLRDQMYSRRFASHSQSLLSYMFSWQKEYARICYLWTHELPRFYLGDSRVLPAHSPNNTFLLSSSFKAMRFALFYGLHFAPIKIAPFYFFVIRTSPFTFANPLPTKVVLEWWSRACQFKYLRFYALPTYFTALHNTIPSKFSSFLEDFMNIGNLFLQSAGTSTLHVVHSEKYITTQLPLEPVIYTPVTKNIIVRPNANLTSFFFVDNISTYTSIRSIFVFLILNLTL